MKLACLHLGFYLASWGMYRGSSFLLWKDYLVHKEAVLHLANAKHLHANKLDLANISDQNIDEIVSLITTMKTSTYPNFYYKQGVKMDANVSSTLATKILLGVLGCVPAYDDFFKKGLREHGYADFLKPRKNSIQKLVKFYNDHHQQFSYVATRIHEQGGIQYPPMKLVDMYFWK